MPINGYSDIPEWAREILEENPDVCCDSNNGGMDTISTIGKDIQVILLVPDAEGMYNLEAARAQV